MNDELDMINDVSGGSPEFRTELAEQLAELVPEAVADGKIDVEKLKELLEGDASDTSERFGLFWPGKKRAMRAAQTPTTATLKPDKKNSKDWDTTKNVFIEGDNLEVLKILQKHYHGKIKMIYIDPPYNTGKDFVYPDNYKEGLETYLEWSKQVNEEGKKLSSNSEAEGRYHSNWLIMMYPRLKLARNLLTEDGVIFISIDDSEVAHLRAIADEVFGANNFVTQFIWHSSTGGGIRAKYVNVNHQYVLCYVRNTRVAPVFWAKLSPEAVSQYKQADEKGKYRDKDFVWKNSSTNPNQVYEIEAPDGQVVRPKPGYIYRFIESRFKQELAAGNITFKKTDRGPLVDEKGQQARWNIYVKKYLKDGRGAPTSVIPRGLVGINNEGTVEVQNLFGERVFENPKNVRLIDYLLTFGSDKRSTVLDFFAGSSSTAHAVMAMNAADGGTRRYIQVQLPEPTGSDSIARRQGFSNIADLSRERIRLAGKQIQTESSERLQEPTRSHDVGFRAYKLADTNFTKWRTESNTDATELEQHLVELRDSNDDNATPEDLLTEILIKQGHSLIEQIHDVEIDELPFKAVVRDDEEEGAEDTLVLAYLDEHTRPTLKQLRAAVDTKPAQFIILEDAFQGDDELKTNLAQMCRTIGVELWTA